MLVAAESLTVLTDGHRCELVGLHSLDDDGRLLLRVPGDCRPAAEVALAPRGDLAAVLKFTDVAPVAVRDRVRSRVTLAGWLTPVEPAFEATRTDLRLDFAHAALETAAGTVAVGLDQLALARPDPLAAREAGMLTHLADRHSDVLALLTRLVDPQLVQGVTRVWPWSMDRYGLTLRLEYTHAHRDVRLPFPVPLSDAAQAGDQIQAMLAAAHACPRRHRLRSRP